MIDMAVIKLSKKAKLDQLIARLTLQTGIKPTQQDVLDAAVDLAETHYNELEDLFIPKPLLDNEKFARIIALRKELAQIEWVEPSRENFSNEADADIYSH
jgi:hypothetical protein